ncbi:MAG: hypothetical protein GWN31_15795 [Candidatus Thorarchaeota archaeon]|nr:hypothetical protein [Candidatus Thorarchaeota archaeon]NIW15348.1 hypothetical protein [Candidatus Thorarchaeota archaeon]NIW53308.1 hypothetical protein [Candidatus Korarchaeota archaeon]
MALVLGIVTFFCFEGFEELSELILNISSFESEILGDFVAKSINSISKLFFFFVFGGVVNIHNYRRVGRKAIVWEKVDSRVYVTIVEVAYTNYFGDRETRVVAFRIDGRNIKGYRVDIKDNRLFPWEAIDEGTPPRNLKEAKKLVRDYIS